jgi:catechol 2,3-dioxygenase-like lactoylglutathione lyase family enzyme
MMRNMTVPARITVITLGAHDLPALRSFYESLGWKLAISGDEFCAFATRGAVLTLYPRADLAADGRTTEAPRNQGVALSIAINVDEREQVDRAIEGVRAAGATVLNEPTDAEWGGRSAYWADPENNVWEVAWVPPDNAMAHAIRAASGIPAD